MKVVLILTMISKVFHEFCIKILKIEIYDSLTIVKLSRNNISPKLPFARQNQLSFPKISFPQRFAFKSKNVKKLMSTNDIKRPSRVDNQELCEMFF